MKNEHIFSKNNNYKRVNFHYDNLVLTKDLGPIKEGSVFVSKNLGSEFILQDNVHKVIFNSQFVVNNKDYFTIESEYYDNVKRQDGGWLTIGNNASYKSRESLESFIKNDEHLEIKNIKSNERNETVFSVTFKDEKFQIFTIGADGKIFYGFNYDGVVHNLNQLIGYMYTFEDISNIKNIEPREGGEGIPIIYSLIEFLS